MSEFTKTNPMTIFVRGALHHATPEALEAARTVRKHLRRLYNVLEPMWDPEFADTDDGNPELYRAIPVLAALLWELDLILPG